MNKLYIIAFVFFLHACKDEENNFNPLETGFVSHLSFNGNLNDANNYALVLDSCASSSYVTGVHGEAFMLDENCQHVRFDKMTFRNSQKISVSVWFKTSENGSTWHFISSSDFVIFTSYGKAGMAISVPETNSAKGVFEPDEWTHMVSTYDGMTIKTYINGQLAATTKHKGEISAPGYSFELNGSGHWIGAIDDLYIFDTVLNEEQVKKLYEM